MRPALLLAAAACAAGCAPEVRVDEAALAASRPRTLAVLPFELADDEAGPRGADRTAALRALVHDRASTLRWLHLEEREVDRLLRRAGLDPATAPPAELARALAVDALLFGAITSLSNLQGGVIYRQAITGELRLVDARGAELARVTHTASDVGGLLLNYSQALEAIQETLDNSSDVGFLRLAERWADAVARALPAPPDPATPAPPALEAVALRAPAASLAPGDLVEVEVRAAAGLAAAFDLGHGVAEVPLVEEAPGAYRGAYRVAVGDEAGEPPSVHVSDRFDTGALRVLRDDPTRIAARPPAAPTGLTGRPEGGGVRLAWTCAGAAKARVYGLDRRGVATLLAEVSEATAVVPAGAPRLAVAGLDARGLLGAPALVDAPGGAR